jgi:hypothetical protein
MNWKKIDNATRVQNVGEFKSWKQQVSNDCFNQCVYCSIHENPWGGIDHYHIDHFRPQSKFPHLKHIITNLYHSCPVCNRFKSDDWPSEPDDLEKPCYPDPSVHNYCDLFHLNTENYNLSGLYVSTKYVVNRLFLNRPQLVYERRESLLKLKAEALISDVLQTISLTDDVSLIKQAFDLIAQITQHLLTRGNIVPYRLLEIRKSGR